MSIQTTDHIERMEGLTAAFVARDDVSMFCDGIKQMIASVYQLGYLAGFRDSDRSILNAIEKREESDG